MTPFLFEEPDTTYDFKPQRRSRIAIVTTSYPRTDDDPSGHFVRSEARALAKNHDVFVLTTARIAIADYDLVTPLDVDGGEAFGWPGTASRLRERPWRVASVLSWTARARNAIQVHGPFDRIIAHWCIPSAWPIAVADEHALVEIVSHGGDIRLLKGLPSLARTSLVTQISSRATVWQFVSDALLNDLCSMLPREARIRVEKIARIAPCKIDMPDVSREIRLHRDEADARYTFVCAGRLVQDKRIDQIIEYVATQSKTAQLVVIGDGPEKENLERLANLRGVDARFTGKLNRTQALAWIGAADMFVHASKAEGCSTVLREAKALGVPTSIIE